MVVLIRMHRKNSGSVLATKYYSDYEIKKRLATHAARMGKRRGTYSVWWGNRKERDDLEDLSVHIELN